MRVWRIATLIVLFSGFNSTLLAQKPVQSLDTPPKIILTGVIYDINGAVIVGAKVLVENDKGVRYEAAANDEGVYSVVLPLATYNIQVSATSFCSFRIKRYKVVNSSHNKMSLDFVLDVADSHSPCLKNKWEKLDKQLDNEIIMNFAKRKITK